MDAVDRDAVAPELHSQCLRHVHHGAVAGAAAEISRIARIGAADVDDATPAPILHEGQDGARAAQRTDVLDVEVLDQVLVDDRLDRTGGRGRAAWGRATVDEDIDAAHLPRGFGNHLFDLGAARDVGY
jgi:hypothetical protein